MSGIFVFRNLKNWPLAESRLYFVILWCDQTKPLQQYFHMVLFISYVGLTF